MVSACTRNFILACEDNSKLISNLRLSLLVYQKRTLTRYQLNGNCAVWVRRVLFYAHSAAKNAPLDLIIDPNLRDVALI